MHPGKPIKVHHDIYSDQKQTEKQLVDRSNRMVTSFPMALILSIASKNNFSAVL